eukprot:TRINITY_DN74285_c0_g1_i1.p1 TRINITY_DN74285_c0_g1~~TRINITY_DN74285_c0_g1_i1.p1  ORF type:complete len:236 (-),score=81.02 TRINITY_DN74285_c0_g1_i1:139-795(-)
MGALFSKKDKSRITEQDKAVLGLKKQRDQLKQYQKRILGVLEKDRDLARKLLKEGKKDRAKLLLRKKKFQEGLLEKTDGQLDNLERLVHDIEFAQVQKEVLDGLKDGNAALEKANAMFSIDEIEDILADTQEASEKQQEITDMLSGQLTQEDEDDVIAELDQLLEMELEPTIAKDITEDLPGVPETEPERVEDQLPDVPTQEPKANKEKPQRVAVEAS